MKKFALLIIAPLALSACVSREQADERLSVGCAAAIEIYLADEFKIKEIKSKTFNTSAEEGDSFREVKLDYLESDGWANVNKTGKCIFAERFGFMSTSHSASLYQVEVNGQAHGKKGKELLGSYEEILKLTETVDRAMSGM